MSSVSTTPVIPRREVIKVATASLLGTILEFYDFLLYGYVAPVFAVLFFPSTNALASLMAVFVTFAVGYIGRPVGAILFGHIGDRIGRKQALMLTLFIMGLASFLTALLPTFQQIGIMAPIILVMLRLMQGLALGGEFGGGLTLTGEFAPKQNRGFWVGILQMSQGGGSIAASGSVAILSVVMSASGFQATGWRWLFAFGVVVALIGLALRTGISESPLFEKKKATAVIEKVPVLDVLKTHWKMVLNGMGVGLFGTVMVYLTSVFAVSYMITVSQVSLATATLITSIGVIPYIVFSPISGWLADKFGRRPVGMLGFVGALVFIYPYFLLLSSGVLVLMILAQAIIFTCQAMALVSAAIITEIFPTRARVTGVNLTYQLYVTIFGGTTPFIATYLLAVTGGWRLAPMIWAIIGIIISIISLLVIRETKGEDLATTK
jgi:MFS family permease